VTRDATIALFFGTRPQVIKASVLWEALARVAPVLAIDTGQHYDYQLHQVHYDQLGVRPPNAHLGAGSASHARQTAAMAAAAEDWLLAHAPRFVVVIGDTNSTVACALAAAKLGIPVAHVEAGLRLNGGGGGALIPEEVNRRRVDAIATVLFAPSRRAEEILRRERPDAAVHFVGDVAYDVLQRALPRLPSVAAVPAYDRGWGSEFVFVTLHRAELVDDAEKLAGVMRALAESPLPGVFPVHPRTARALERPGNVPIGRLRRCEPLGYLESIALLRHAAAAVTDSGGVQREAYWLGVPCLTVRDESEWVETLESGANRLVAPAAARELPGAIRSAVAGRGRAGNRGGWDPVAYGDGGAAERIATILAACLSSSPSK